jgi:3-phenylpropionate/trans-cinnamate dioxygenase ferredoxin subunit
LTDPNHVTAINVCKNGTTAVRLTVDCRRIRRIADESAVQENNPASRIDIVRWCPMGLVKLAAVASVPPGHALQVQIEGTTLAVFNLGGNFHVIEDRCTHRGAPLSDGDWEGNEVICPWHGARFDLSTGVALSAPATKGVRTYSVQVVDDEILVEFP